MANLHAPHCLLLQLVSFPLLLYFFSIRTRYFVYQSHLIDIFAVFFKKLEFYLHATIPHLAFL